LVLDNGGRLKLCKLHTKYAYLGCYVTFNSIIDHEKHIFTLHFQSDICKNRLIIAKNEILDNGGLKWPTGVAMVTNWNGPRCA
jgi:hypothetical protein